MSEWISVEDRLPADNQRVIVCCMNPWGGDVFDDHMYREEKDHFVRIESYFQTRWVTHWMPLPKPPEV